MVTVDEYLSLPNITEDEKDALQVLRGTIAHYHRNLRLAKTLFKQGKKQYRN